MSDLEHQINRYKSTVGCSICFSPLQANSMGWLWVSCDTVCVFHFPVLPCASVRQHKVWHSSSCRQENSVCESGHHTSIQNNAGSKLTSHRLVLVSMAWQCASLTKSRHISVVYIFEKYALGCGTCKQVWRQKVQSSEWVQKKKKKSNLPCKQKFGEYHRKGEYFGACCDAAVDVETSPFN